MDQILKILVIDQNANNADNIVRTIKSSGFAVRETIVSSKEQFEEVKNLEVSPHIIIQANNVDELSIQDARAYFKTNDHETPIVALSEDAHNHQAQLYIDGANIVLPYDDQEQLKQTTSRFAQTEFYIQDLKVQADNYKDLDQRYNKILDTSRDAICYIHEGLHAYANASYLELFDIDGAEDASILSILELVSPDDQDALKSILKDVNKNHTSGTASLNFKSDEEYLHTEIEYNPVLVEGETCVQFVLHMQTNESKELQEQLSYISERDHETGFFHRKSLTDKIQEAIEAAQSGETPSTYIQIDIANIDTIKDQFGISAIDKLGAHIADALKQVCTKEDALGKINDESFGILTFENNEDKLVALGARLRDAIDNNPVTVNSLKISPELYIGATALDPSLKEVADALSAAKSACDYAWENEIQELYIFAKESRSLTGTLLDQKWTQELQDAIRENRLLLLFQPVVSITGKTEDRYQVYTQLVSKEGAKISVAELLPSIERSGVSAMLDRWVVTTAIKKLAEHGETSPDSQFFIKLTTGALNDQQFTPWLEKQCKSHNVDPFRLVFDMREESIVSHLKDAREFATRLKQLGCQIAIDAFGISQEPEKILSMIPASYLKLSFQLMASLKNGDKERIEDIKHICEQAKQKNTMTIAPFVESAEALSQIWSINIDFVSGDFFREPNENLGYDFSSAA
ncbi:MAG: EAL domain-containing protein [Gammaproteobacteria bacterium]